MFYENRDKKRMVGFIIDWIPLRDRFEYLTAFLAKNIDVLNDPILCLAFPWLGHPIASKNFVSLSVDSLKNVEFVFH
jgi:hypothetical protein